MSKQSKAERKGTTKQTNQYNITCDLILPFRPNTPFLGIGQEFFNDNYGTSISLGFADKFRVDGSTVFDTHNHTQLKVITKLSFAGDYKELRNKLISPENCEKILTETILPRVNYFFMQIKKSEPKAVRTGVLRNIGLIDCSYIGLALEDEPILRRATSTFFSDGCGKINFNTEPLKNEWMVLTRAVDLVNHGYHVEAFIVGFSLLDDLVQKFIKSKLPHLDPSEATELLRTIETRRLYTYLGILCKLALGKSIFTEQQGMKERLSSLNHTRNKIMHEGNNCSIEEARNGLETILEILKFLKANGADYDLPEKLEFW